MNYIEALQVFLQNDTEINQHIGDKVSFLRFKKEIEKPCIVFNEQERMPEVLDTQGFEKGIDVFPVLIDVIVDYKDTVLGRKLRQKIREKIGHFSGILAKKNIGSEEKILWEGNIEFIKFMPCDYSETTDGVLRGGLYLFKHYYDHT